MTLYRWSSTLLEEWGKGHIIAVADTPEAARKQVIAEWEPLEEGPAEDSYLSLLAVTGDEDYEEEYTKRYQKLLKDLEPEPEIITGNVLFIQGSQ